MKVAIWPRSGYPFIWETVVKPKPMVEVGEQPMLWHILKHYAHYGSKVLHCSGLRASTLNATSWTITWVTILRDLSDGAIHPHHSGQEDWIIHPIDTGTATNTGGRSNLRTVVRDETLC
jgi:glucose-1-phosphate cytidylyltransferase